MKTFINKLDFELDSELTEQPFDFPEFEIMEFEGETFYLPYYRCKIIVNKNSGLPVKYSNGLEFDPNIHALVEHFSTDQIKLFPHTNESGTLAYIPGAVPCVKLYVKPKIDTPDQLVPIIANYVFLQQRNSLVHYIRCCRLKTQIPLFSKNEIYNLLLLLNGRLPEQLPITSINKLTSYIQAKINSNELAPAIDCMVSIRTKDFYDKFLIQHTDKDDNEDAELVEYVDDETGELRYISPAYEKIKVHIRYAIMHEVNLIKANINRITISKEVDAYLDKNPNLEYMQLVDLIKKKFKYSVQHAKRIIAKYREGANRSHRLLINGKSTGGDHFAPPSKSDQKIKRFVRQWAEVGCIGSPTQKEVGIKCGLSIRTIKNKWNDITHLLNEERKKKQENLTPFPVSRTDAAHSINITPLSHNFGCPEKERGLSFDTDCTLLPEPDIDSMAVVDQILKDEFALYKYLVSSNKK